MARLNTAALIQAATVIDRVTFVRSDPAAAKAATEAWTDGVRAGRSACALAREIRAAWNRSGDAYRLA